MCGGERQLRVSLAGGEQTLVVASLSQTRPPEARPPHRVQECGSPPGGAGTMLLVTTIEKHHQGAFARIQCICIVGLQRHTGPNPVPLLLRHLGPSPWPGGSPPAHPFRLTCRFQMHLSPKHALPLHAAPFGLPPPPTRLLCLSAPGPSDHPLRPPGTLSPQGGRLPMLLSHFLHLFLWKLSGFTSYFL